MSEDKLTKTNDADNFIKDCQEFVASTKTDLALAHYYLQNNKFDLKLALKEFSCQEHVVIRGFTVPRVERYGLSELKVLSWNLEGLEPIDRLSRTKRVIEVIKSCKANIVLLQELIDETVNQIREALKSDFRLFIDDSCESTYFCGILIDSKIESIKVIEESFKIKHFDQSSSGRNMLSLKLRVNNVELAVLTAHLESTKQYSEERKEQLKEAFEEMKTCDISIFAGDLNLRDKELIQLGGLPEGVVDVWQSAGERPEARYTWDPRRNTNASLLCPGAFGQRFDRMYLFSAEDCKEKLVPVDFELDGLEKIERGVRHPSDHWAILGTFEL